MAFIQGRVRKNSGGKGQAHYQPQVSTGKRRPDQPLVLGDYTPRSETSVNFTGQVPEWSDCEEPAVAVTGVTCNYL